MGDAERHARAMALLAEALEQPEHRRDAWVRSACAGDPGLRDEVLSLLAHDGSVDALEPGAGAQLLRELSPEDAVRRDGATATTGAPADTARGLSAGDVIDRYRLLQRIGEGGFGTVWMAEQHVPVKRKVALKIIKLGMDTKAVVARFEAERQALAMMDHPHIAKVLDGGATESGRPYFVMELVKGVPITTYCDEARLPLRERLRLFADVCRALQHAHGKGVIHRDIKPSNVLVTLLDGEPVPKIIDFGVAKATSAELTQHTLFTEFQQMVGTPEYMAPEQTALSALDVDTRADVYSLGVLLYELLTGTRPFDLKTAMAKGYEEMLRTIREDEPVRPSTRISTLGDTASTVASLRHAAPRELSSALRGELDWIVLKALEKDRGRRYDTAAAFGADVDRYLADEPVLASPPSRTYLARKFVRRHRGAVAAAAALLVVLLAGLAGTAWGWLRSLDANAKLSDALTDAQHQKAAADMSAAEADVARQRAERANTRAEAELVRATEIKQVVAGMLTSLSPYEVGASDITLLRTLLDRTAVTLDDGSISDPLVRAELHLVVADAYRLLSLLPSAIEHAEKGWELRRDTLGEEHRDTIDALPFLAEALFDGGRVPESASCFERIVAFDRQEYGNTDLRTAWAVERLGIVYGNMARAQEGCALLEEVYGIVKSSPPEDPFRLRVELDLAGALMSAARPHEARSLLEHELAVLEPLSRTQEGDPSDPPATSWSRKDARYQYLRTLLSYGDLLHDHGSLEEALPVLQQAHDELAAMFGPAGTLVRTARILLEDCYRRLERFDEQLQLAQAGLEADQLMLDARDPFVLRSRNQVVDAMWRLGDRRDEAWRLCEALWSDVLACCPDDFVRFRIASVKDDIMWARGDADALAPFLEHEIAAVSRLYPSPRFSETRMQLLGMLADVYNQLGRWEDLARTCRELLASPDELLPLPETILRNRLNLAYALDKCGRTADALEQRELALRWLGSVGEPQDYAGELLRDAEHDLQLKALEDVLVSYLFERPELFARLAGLARRPLEVFLDDWDRDGDALGYLHVTPRDANDLAWWYLNFDVTEDRDPALALRLARYATFTGWEPGSSREAKWGSPDPVKLDTLALALFANGDVQGALDTGTEALALLTDATSAYRPDMEAQLARFQAAAAAGAGARSEPAAR